MPHRSDPDLEQALERKFNSLRQSPHLAARLRQRVSPEEAQIALRALLRRDAYDPAARIVLFRELAAASRFDPRGHFSGGSHG